VAKSSTPAKGPRKSVRDGKSEFGKDRRRKHHHFLVTVNYADGETFGRVYTNKEKATRFPRRITEGDYASQDTGMSEPVHGNRAMSCQIKVYSDYV